jgi:hypothetical protein
LGAGRVLIQVLFGRRSVAMLPVVAMTLGGGAVPRRIHVAREALPVSCERRVRSGELVHWPPGRADGFGEGAGRGEEDATAPAAAWRPPTALGRARGLRRRSIGQGGGRPGILCDPGPQPRERSPRPPPPFQLEATDGRGGDSQACTVRAARRRRAGAVCSPAQHAEGAGRRLERLRQSRVGGLPPRNVAHLQACPHFFSSASSRMFWAMGCAQPASYTRAQECCRVGFVAPE